MTDYRVRTGCEIAGRWRDAGETVSLTAGQAQELAPPFGNVVSRIVPETPNESSDHAKLHRNKRRDRRAAQRLGTHPAVDPQDPDDADRREGNAPDIRQQDP